MTSLDDAETALIRELETRGVRVIAEKLVALRRRRGMLVAELATEGSPWIADFRHMRALAYWTLVQIERRDGQIHVRARQDIGDDWNEGTGADLGLAIDDLILLVAQNGNNDLSVSDETIGNLIEIRQERGREREAVEIDEEGNVVLADRDPNSAICEACETIIREGEFVYTNAEGLHFCETCYEHANEPIAGRVEVEAADTERQTRIALFGLLEVGDVIELDGFPRMTVASIPSGSAFEPNRISADTVAGGHGYSITREQWIVHDGRRVPMAEPPTIEGPHEVSELPTVEEIHEAARRGEMGVPLQAVTNTPEALCAGMNQAGISLDNFGPALDDGPPGPPTPGEVYALLEVGDHVVLNGMEYVVAIPCGPGFRSSIQTRPITGGIIEDVTFDDWIAQNGRKRDPSEYMPAPANEEGPDNAR